MLRVARSLLKIVLMRTATSSFTLQSFLLRQLRAPLTDEHWPPIEKIVADVSTECSEFVDCERNAVLIAIASERDYSGDVFRFRGAVGSRFRHLLDSSWTSGLALRAALALA
jgi:hypothetical protein